MSRFVECPMCHKSFPTLTVESHARVCNGVPAKKAPTATATTKPPVKRDWAAQTKDLVLPPLSTPIVKLLPKSTASAVAAKKIPSKPTRGEAAAAAAVAAVAAASVKIKREPGLTTTETVTAAAASVTTASAAPRRKRARESDSGEDDVPYDHDDAPPAKVARTSSNAFGALMSASVRGSKWGRHATIIVRNAKTIQGEKIAAFDMDSTLITTKSGSRFARGRDDWQWLDERIPGLVRSFAARGYKICIFTNQHGVVFGRKSQDNLEGKITDFLAEGKFEAQVFAATEIDKYRKPGIGMWEHMRDECNGGIKIDVAASFYVGDAAGRPHDHSADDLGFAGAIGLKFMTPEDFLVNHGKIGVATPAPVAPAVTAPARASSKSYPTWEELGEMTKQLLRQAEPAEREDESESRDTGAEMVEVSLADIISRDLAREEQEIVLLVGSPASGKSTFARKCFGEMPYMRVNQDRLGTWQACLDYARQALEGGRSIVVDNTNYNRETRGRYLQLAAQHECPVRVFWFDYMEEECMMLRDKREAKGFPRLVRDNVFRWFDEHFEMPDESEAFDEFYRISFSELESWSDDDA